MNWFPDADDSNKVNMFPEAFEPSRHGTSEVVTKGVQAHVLRSHSGRYELQKPIAFNGLLTNKVLTALPGPDFAYLLSYLEPISLSSGQHVYEFGQTIDYIYFPETAVVSHLYTSVGTYES